MPLPPKEIVCQCGHTMTLSSRNLRCVKCGKHLYYNDDEKKRHRRNHFYIIAVFVGTITLITYLFVEMIVRPLFG